MFDQFQLKYNLSPRHLTYIPYGSRVYGTHQENSDYDFLCVINGNDLPTGTEYAAENLNITVYQHVDFQKQLDIHKIHALEAYFLTPEIMARYKEYPVGVPKLKFKLDLVQLRHSLSEKSSHSFVKAKKKIEVEKDFYVGWKSLFHAMRILKFGIRIATDNKIVYDEANFLWDEIRTCQQYNWAYFKEKYQTVINDLSTEFKKVAPKF